MRKYAGGAENRFYGKIGALGEGKLARFIPCPDARLPVPGRILALQEGLCRRAAGGRGCLGKQAVPANV